MGNELKIKITADDKATASIKNINESISKMLRPFQNIAKTAATISRTAGVPKLAKGLGAVAKSANSVAGHVREIAAPLTAIVGGGTIAGLAAMTAEWGRMGLQITQSAQAVDMSTRELQGFNGVAKLFGLSADTMTGGLKTIGDTFEGALFGRNQDALLLLNRLGIGIHKLKNGGIDTARAFMDISRAIKGTDSPEVQRLIARTFGVEGLLPVLVKGPEAISAYLKRVQELSGVSNEATERAAAFGMSLNYLHAAADGLKNSISDALVPALRPLVDNLTDWVGANRELVATKVKDFVTYLIAETPKAAKMIDGMAASVGGWKNVLIGLGGLMALNFIAPLITLTATLVALAPALLAAWPILLGIAAIGGAAYAGYKVYQAAQSMPAMDGNNPGNLRKWSGAPTINGFASFQSPLDGLTAMAKNLEGYGRTGTSTLSGIINRWAPASDGNNVGAYISDISRQTGFGANQRLDLNNPAAVSSLMSAMIRHEKGASDAEKYTPEMIGQAVASAIAQNQQQMTVRFENLPEGMRATARNGSTPRVSHALPTSVSP